MIYDSQSPKKFLSEWARKNSITPVILSERTGLSYQHCWGLLAGPTKITLYTLAVLLVTYGEAGPAIALAKMMRSQWLQKRLEQMESNQ